jgi:hypothetical protein
MRLVNERFAIGQQQQLEKCGGEQLKRFAKKFGAR